MQTNALTDAALTQNTNGQEPQPEQETTAIVSPEPDVIEGEFIEILPPENPEDQTPPKQKPYWLFIPFTILFCLLFVSASLLLPLLSPTATITIFPAKRTISLTTAIQVSGRQLPALTLTQSTDIPATGKKHQPARYAAGTITFYNGSFTSQTIAAGTILTGASGVQIITDQPARIPAGNPPVYGQATVSAHALIPGTKGNIPAFDINQACCANSVLAKNTRTFSGGASARDVIVVTKQDINNAVTSLLVTLSRSEDAALRAQLLTGEELITPSCTPHIASSHRTGDEAPQVSVTASVTCEGIAVASRQAYARAMQAITRDLKTGYMLKEDIHVSVLNAKISDPAGIATLTVKIEAASVYHLSPVEKQRILTLIAGKTPQRARALLLQLPGIAGATINSTGTARTLPQDPGKISIVVVYRD